MIKKSLKNLAINDKDDSIFTSRLYLENVNNFFINSVVSPFAIDRQRIVDSASFRRLQYKTQVFVNHQGDHFRTRLTHTLEVAQIARLIANSLDLNQDLAEVISLIHDMGHPPFGHAGEEVINSKMQNFAGFSHNDHTLKIITKTESFSERFLGLNLTLATLEGVVKHNGKIENHEHKNLNKYLIDFNNLFNLSLTKNPSLEAQISAISDDIAYNNHDIEDGVRAGLINVDDLLALPLVGEIYKKLLLKNTNISNKILVSEAKKILTDFMIKDVVDNTFNNILNNNIQSHEDIRNFPNFLVNFSSHMQNINDEIKKFLNNKMYRHSIVNQMSEDAQIIINSIFDHVFENPKKLPKEFYEKYESSKNIDNLAELTCDYIAGMTDRFAIKCFKEMID